MQYIIQFYTQGMWHDHYQRRRKLALAEGDAQALSKRRIKNGYGGLTRVVLRQERTIRRYGQAHQDGQG